jgi:predicted RNA-binding protein with RPS1 domain
MTDQERAEKERNELQSQQASEAAVAEPETAQQEQPAATDLPAQEGEPAAAAATTPAEAPDAAESVSAAEESAGESAPAADEPVAIAHPESTAEAEGPTAGTSEAAEPDVVVVTHPESTPEAEGPTEATAEPVAETGAEAVPELVAEAGAEAVPAEATTEPVAETGAEAVPAEATTEPVAEAGAEAALAEATTEPVAEASYTPTEEDTSGKPRRVKDLEPGMELQGRVTSIALYGVFVDIGVGRDGLVHISEMSDTRIDSPSDVVKIGDIITVRVKSVEPDERRISLTMRSKERSQESRARGRRKPEINREALAALRVGDNVEGTITGISNFGVFVDIGVGKDGLVHVSELAEGRVEKPEDVVSVGQAYTFKILEVDADGARISLSLRRAQRSQRLQQLETGQIVEGTVSGIAPFGAFVDIGVGRDGLVHISELTDGRIGKVEDAVKVGDKVQVRVLDVDAGNKRISLTMRLEDTPREPQEIPERYRREDRPAREERAPRQGRPERSAPQREPEVYSTPDDPEEQFSGDATIEDLLSKFGGRRDRRRRQDEDDEDENEDRGSRRQRDAIRRTLQQMDDE